MLGYCASILSILLLIFNIQQSKCAIEFDCKPNMAHQTFPSPDGNPEFFFICEKGSAWIVKCPAKSGFLATETLHGCVPWSDWPNAPEDRIPSCSVGQNTRLYRNVDPRLYFACKAVDTPIIIKCPKGHAFTYTKSTVGCVLWKDWVLADQLNDD